MPRIVRTSLLTISLLSMPVLTGWASATDDQTEILQVRDAVWRAWFAGDTAILEKYVPPDTIVISAGEEKWKNQAGVLQSSSEFHAAGGKLLRLEFPRTEIQRFGDVAVIWSQYALEFQVDGKRSTGAGRVTEVFVRRNGRWSNPGWHTESTKSN